MDISLYHWKISFNQDQNKQAHEVLFSRKITKSSHPKMRMTVSSVNFQKHLGVSLEK